MNIPPKHPESSTQAVAFHEEEAYAIMHDECEQYLKYDWRRKIWYCLPSTDAAIWEQLPESEVRTLVQQTMYDRWGGEKVAGLRRQSVANNIATHLKGHVHISKDSSDFDADSRYLGAQTIVIDTQTGEPLNPPHFGSHFLITKKLAVDPAPSGARPERWLQFLDQCTGGDRALIAWLRRFCGFCLLGNPKPEKMYLFICGPTNSGKSTFLETIERVMCDYAFNAEASMFTRRGSAFADNRFEMARLKGVRFILMDEPEEGSLWNMNRLNRVTSGSMLTAEIKGGNTMNFKSTGVLACDGNYIPRSTDTSGALESRSKIVEFPYQVKPDQMDRHLEDHLTAEMPEILRWMLDGIPEYREMELGTCPAIQAASENYSREQSWLRRCARDCFEVGGDHLKTKEIHPIFITYWEHENGAKWVGSEEAKNLTPKRLSTAINQELKMTRKFRYERSGRNRGWHGIKIK